MMKTFLAAATLAILPLGAFAQCAGHGAAQEAMSCAAGTQWDAETRTCVTIATG